MPRSFVLYWMRSAQRATHNPSLCVAAHAAQQLGLPVLVLLTVEDGQPHDTARRHTFLLEGVRDVAGALRRRGFSVHVYVHSSAGRTPWQLTLAHRAAIVITDEPFCDPWLSSCTALARAGFAAPLFCVDASCVVPCATVAASATHRAGNYERSTASARRATLTTPYVDASYDASAFAPLQAFFEDTPLDDIASLVRSCSVDHTVEAVSHTRGGSAAGEARWAAFVRSGGLKRYAKTRNNVLLSPTGVSRMSPYLNFGMVSPFRVARNGLASDKYSYEIGVWRELSYAYVFRNPQMHARVEGLPAWARRALASRPPAARPLSCEQLAACASGDALWDAMQRSLVVAGELHNNARMTWGKAVLQWSTSGEDALSKLVFLNDHFALDGQSPPSYGGLLWCLGLFCGGPSIKERPLRVQAAKLNSAKLEERTKALVQTTAGEES
jgi:deoxyribodipyrimidine photolyase